MKSLRVLFGLLPFAASVSISAAPATAASEIAVPPGFKVELLHSAAPGRPPAGEGSWIAMCKDGKGRLIISPQDFRQPFVRVTLTADGKIEKTELAALPVGEAMGLLWAYDALYVSGKGGERKDVLGLYKLTDTDGDDQFDKVDLLKKFDGAGGEHGSHALELGPDGKIYYMHGNFVKVPDDISPQSQHKNYADDQVLPRGEDGNGFGRGLKPPGGFILRGDRDGKNWEMLAGGMRNTYDFAISPDGEMFAFDSDMEWDWGMPWYRPTRIYHLVSGGDYGFREGTAKWPAYYQDGLPPVVAAGIGSPTGVTFGTGAKFPAKYQKALYAMDWSYGRIFAVHLAPQGATYTATTETFVKGKPLNVTDMVIGNDGALYFTTGGRGTQSGLYRVSYTGSEATSPAPKENAGSEERALRRKLEAFHGKTDASAVNTSWAHLNSPDRWIRYAARIAIESQDSETWAQRALQEETKDGGLTALLALARVGKSTYRDDIIRAIGRIGRQQFDDQQNLDALRVLEVALSRMGRPGTEMSEDLARRGLSIFPTGKPLMDRELAQVLIYVNAPGIIERVLALAQTAPTFEDQMFYMFHLRNVKSGWTIPQREQYFAWLNANAKKSVGQHPAEFVKFFTEAGREYSDGASYPNFFKNLKKEVSDQMSPAEREQLAPVISGESTKALPAVVARSTVKEWTTADLLAALDEIPKEQRNFQRGKEAYAAAQCVLCHRMRDEGGAVGPELTAISQRFTRRDILESMTEPSKVVSEQYAGTDFVLKNGDEISGRVLEETDQKYVVLNSPLTNGKVEIKKADVAKRQTAKLSTMPEGLINVLKKEEILDLIAYLEAAGRETHALFQKKN